MTIDPTNLLDDDDDDFETAASGTPSGGADDEFEEFEIPPSLVGLVHGHVSAVKRNPNKPQQLILEIKSEEANSRGATASCFLDLTNARNKVRLREICTAIGLKVVSHKRSFKIQGGTKALTNKAGLFVVETFERDDGTVSSSLAWGFPKPGRSADWDEYAKQVKFSDEQKKVLKSSCGVIPKSKHSLFDNIFEAALDD